jgi:Ca2+-binding EF-hand superfamily protein
MGYDRRPICVHVFPNDHRTQGLDTDRNRVLSASEIANAPSVLRSLDINHDGKLSPEECGFDIGDVAATNRGPEFSKSARLEFMRFHPVLAALDADHDGEISVKEIQNASAALQTLDRNRDHKLTVGETLPDPVANAVALFMRLDSNRDGKISAAERSNRQAVPYRELLSAADRNTDGIVTEEELTKEIRLRAVLNGMKVPIIAFDRK